MKHEKVKVLRTVREDGKVTTLEAEGYPLPCKLGTHDFTLVFIRQGRGKGGFMIESRSGLSIGGYQENIPMRRDKMQAMFDAFVKRIVDVETAGARIANTPSIQEDIKS